MPTAQAALLLLQHLAIVTIEPQNLLCSINQELLFLKYLCWLFFSSFPLFFSPQTDLWERAPQHRITLFGCQILLAVGCSQGACMPLPEKLSFSAALNPQHPSGSQGRKEQPCYQPKAFIFFPPSPAGFISTSHIPAHSCWCGPGLSPHCLHTTGLQSVALAPNGDFRNKRKAKHGGRRSKPALSTSPASLPSPRLSIHRQGSPQPAGSQPHFRAD